MIAASLNCADYLHHPAASLRGRPLPSLLPPETIHHLRNALQRSSASRAVERLDAVTVAENGLADAAVHLEGEHVVLEFLPHQGARRPGDTLFLLKAMLARLQQGSALVSFLQQASQQIRAMTGFDRVMVCRRLPDGNVRVMTETARAGLPPFLGFYFPPDGFPAEDRGADVSGVLRAIPDTGYTAIPLDPAMAPDGKPFDLDLAVLRGLARPHLEHLRSVGAAAALTLPLTVDGGLWGTISCHHSEPRNLPSHLCGALELFGQILSLQLAAQLQADARRCKAAARDAHDRLLRTLPPQADLADSLDRYRDLLEEFIAYDGLAVWSHGRLAGIGSTPPAEAVDDLVGFLNTTSGVRSFATDCLARQLPQAAAYTADVSGLLAVPISRSPREYLLFFRREVVQSITWAAPPRGDPAPGPEDGGALRPYRREAGAAWRETLRGRSAAWTDVELRVAEGLRIALLEVALRNSDAVEQERHQIQERQEFHIAEMHHRVKNVLALVRALARKSRDQAGSLEEFSGTLEHRIRALSTAHDLLLRSASGPAPLRDLLVAELEPFMDGSAAQVQLEGPPLLLTPPAHTALALVVHELATNAAKHGALGTADGRLAVSWSNQDDRFSMSWRESGGRPVRPPVGRRGFGSTVIERTIPFELGGGTTVAFEQEGLQVEIEIPGELVMGGSEDKPEHTKRLQSRTLPPGLRFLVVEDNMILALDIEDMLTRNGAAAVEVVSTCEDALKVLDGAPVDVALLDLRLVRGDSLPVAHRLSALGIPFAFATGYGERALVPAEFIQCPVIGKPYTESYLVSRLAELLDAPD